MSLYGHVRVLWSLTCKHNHMYTCIYPLCVYLCKQPYQVSLTVDSIEEVTEENLMSKLQEARYELDKLDHIHFPLSLSHSLLFLSISLLSLALLFLSTWPFPSLFLPFSGTKNKVLDAAEGKTRPVRAQYFNINRLQLSSHAPY